jgi:hypothetical protein
MRRAFSSSLLSVVLLAPLGALLAGMPAGCTSSNGTNGVQGLSREKLMDPKTCETCHKDHYREWSGSMHAYAGDDPVFRAMNKRGQRETNGQLGPFCVKCHAPLALANGATKDGLNLDTVDAKLKGVGCFFCHTVDAVEGTHSNPLHLATDNVMRGGFADPVANTAHKATYSKLHDRNQDESAKLCGSCHDIENGHGTKIERTFKEWNDSVFSFGGGATCSQCHMDQSKKPEPIAQAPNVRSRNRHAHTFQGVDTAMTEFPEKETQTELVQKFLNTTFQTALCVEPLGTDNYKLRVIADNVAAGHSFPSGSAQDRRVWFEVIAYKAGAVIYQSGVVPDGQAPTQSPDADMWMARDCNFDDANQESHMFWEAASYEGNGFPAKTTFNPLEEAYYKGHLIQNFPRSDALLPGNPDRVTMRVRVMPMGLEVLDSLVASGDLDPKFRDMMATRTMDIGVTPVLEWTRDAVKVNYSEGGVTVQCVTNSGARVDVTKTPAINKTRCAP